MSKAAFTFALVFSAFAQDQPAGRIQFDWSKLAARAVQKTDINLDGGLLEMASKFLGNDGDQAKVKEVLAGLQGIYVKTFEFDKDGQYSEADVSAIRSQLRAPEWSNIVDVQEKHESTAVYLKVDGKKMQGIVVLSAEPREFTFVQIIGTADLASLSALGGKMGIPNMEFGPKPKPKGGKD